MIMNVKRIAAVRCSNLLDHELSAVDISMVSGDIYSGVKMELPRRVSVINDLRHDAGVSVKIPVDVPAHRFDFGVKFLNAAKRLTKFLFKAGDTICVIHNCDGLTWSNDEN